jgi:hypothetical protein
MVLYHPGGIRAFLESQGVKVTGWKPYVCQMTDALAVHVQGLAAAGGRPYEYLARNYTHATGQSKEDLALQIAARDGITSRLICVFAALEPCWSFDVVGNRATKRLEVVRRKRVCRQFYLYVIDDQLGFCHIKLQSWFPFEIQIWCNGHHMLGRALDKARVRRLQVDNALWRVASWRRAQALADRISSHRWPRLLNRLASWVNPFLPVFKKANFGGYYWVADQAEISTDIVFRTRPALEKILPALCAHAASAFGAEDILRSWGANSPRRSPPRSPPTPAAAPRAGGSNTAWAATTSRCTTRGPHCGWKPPSMTPANSGSCASRTDTGLGAP